MVTILLNKVLMVLLVMAILNVVRHGYYFIQAIVLSSEEEQRKYRLEPNKSLVLAMAIGYIITAIFTGITL